MLINQTLEKLRAMRLDGMVHALEEQRRQNGATELDFEERLGLLVERQWLWKDNVKRSVMLSGTPICRWNESPKYQNASHY